MHISALKSYVHYHAQSIFLCVTYKKNFEIQSFKQPTNFSMPLIVGGTPTSTMPASVVSCGVCNTTMDSSVFSAVIDVDSLMTAVFIRFLSTELDDVKYCVVVTVG